MRNSVLSQRGAMFGLDARIAMAIIAALSLVGGMTMFTTSAEVKAKALVKDIESYKAAIEGLQYDLKSSIHSQVTAAGVLNDKAFAALNDKTMLVAAAQNHWLGPYLKGRTGDITVHENYGQMHLIRASKDDYTDGTCTCYYWLQIDDVPQEAFTEVDTIIDGGAEATPATLGLVRWASGTPDILYVRLGKSL